MSRPDSPFLALFLLAGAAATVVGQQLAPTKEAEGRQFPGGRGAPTTVQLPADRVLTDVLADGTVWAAMPAWKAGFDARGATFVPCLGGDVPSAPATFRLYAARSGEEPLALGDAMPSLVGERVAFERGPACEQYVLRLQGVEQQFVFTTLPSRATLELDVAVDTALEHGADEHGHTFAGVHGGVRYGHAFAIDANGRELSLTTTWTGSALRITVPAAFLADAALPLLVDPLIAPIVTVTGTASPTPLSATDVAHHIESGRHYVTYERSYSATDHDVYVARLDAQMQTLGITVIDISAEYWTNPAIATLEAHDQARVVAEASAANVAPFSIKSRSFPCVAAPVIGPVETLAAGAVNQNYRAPDIGGNSDPVGPSHYLVGYEGTVAANASEAHFERVDVNGVSSFADSVTHGIAFARRVAVSKTCGNLGGNSEAWALVWRAETVGSTDGKLRAAFVRRDGQLVVMPSGNPWCIDLGGLTPNTNSEWDVSSPTDHALGRVFLIAESRLNVSGRNAIHAIAVDRGGHVVANEVQLVAGVPDRRAPSVDCDGTRYALAHTSVYTAADSDVRINTVAIDGGVLELQGFATVSTATDGDRAPAICARRNAAANDFALAWTHDAAGTWSVQAAGFDGVGFGGFTTRATGCSAMTIAATFGRPALGESFTITLANGTGLQGFLVGVPVSYAVPGCAGCLVGADQALLLGNQLTVPVPAEPSLVGATVACQGLQLVGGAAPCLGQFELTDTIDVTIQ